MTVDWMTEKDPIKDLGVRRSSGRPRVYDPEWRRQSQRWPEGLLDDLNEIAESLNLRRDQLVVEICQSWVNDWSRQVTRAGGGDD